VLATADIFLFEDFRLDRRGEGLSRRDEHGIFTPVIGFFERALALDPHSVEAQGPPKMRALYENVYFAGLRKLGVPEE
jgi:hypothetical protein